MEEWEVVCLECLLVDLEPRSLQVPLLWRAATTQRVRWETPTLTPSCRNDPDGVKLRGKTTTRLSVEALLVEPTHLEGLLKSERSTSAAVEETELLPRAVQTEVKTVRATISRARGLELLTTPLLSAEASWTTLAAESAATAAVEDRAQGSATSLTMKLIIKMTGSRTREARTCCPMRAVNLKMTC